MTRSVWKNQPNGKTVRRKKPRRKLPPFVAVPKYMARSIAWRSLSGEAIAAYIELACRYDGMNNGKLHLSARELAVFRSTSHTTTARAIRELIDKGFIEIVRASGFNVKNRQRQAAEYRLTAFHCDVTRKLASKAFMKWRPPGNASNGAKITTSLAPQTAPWEDMEGADENFTVTN